MTDEASVNRCAKPDAAETDDAALFRAYVTSGAENAFAELVRRHIDFVYATALRQLRGNAVLAQDVTQMVFIDMARKAAALARHQVIVGWLHTATRFAAAKAIRAECRRAQREKAAQALGGPSSETGATMDWALVQPVLDDVLGQLKERERSAILLRYFEGRPFSEIGARLALTETAARSCVDRGIERMRGLLARRGIGSTHAALSLALANQVAMAAPAGAAASVTAAALASAAGSGVGALAALGLVFTMSKITIGLAGVVVIAGVATAVREVQAARVASAEIKSLQLSRPARASSRAESERPSAPLNSGGSNADAAELIRVRERIALLKARPEGVVESEMKPITAYVNAGWATPLAAYETQLWARATGNLDEWAKIFGWTERGKAKLDQFFRELPEAVQARHGTPEKLLAPMAAKWGPEGPPVAVQVIGHTNHGAREMVHAWARYASGREGKLDLVFQRHPEGWRVPHPDEMTDGIIASLDPKTGERLPKAKYPVALSAPSP